jgi:hypothetical protein
MLITNKKREIDMTQQIRDLEVVGKDIVGGELPTVITSENTAEEFSAGKTWGRVLRFRRGENTEFFDVGLDSKGNLFINTKHNNAATHVLTISVDGNVTIVGNLTVTGKLTTG